MSRGARRRPPGRHTGHGEPEPARAATPGGARTGARVGERPGVPWTWSLAVALVALVVYLIQSPPVSGDKDSAEFTLVLALNGVAHPTGYPLFTVLGHLFVVLLHALGATWAYAANAWTALGGAVAMCLLHRLALALLPDAPALGRRIRFALATLPVALFAFNPVWTYETTLAEVYGWHVAWVLCASLLFVRIVQRLGGDRDPSPTRLNRAAAAWGFLCGVGGAHHATAIFVAAPLSIAIAVLLAVRRQLTAGRVAIVLGSACVPLLSYLFIPWRAAHPTLYQWNALTPGLGGLITHITAQQYQGYLGRFAPSEEQQRFLRWYVYPFLVPCLVLLVVQALRARDRGARTIRWGLAASALLGTAYAFDYGTYDPSSYFLHPMVLGLAALTQLLGGWIATGATPARAARAVAAALAVASLVLWVPWLRTGQQRTGLYVSFDSLVRRMWDAIPADSAIVFWSNDMIAKLREYQLLEGDKPGITALHGITIYSPSIREEFYRRHGFDPVAGILIAPHSRATAAGRDSIEREAIDSAEVHVNAMTRLPVIHFDPDPAHPSMRLLIKPGTGPSGSRAAPPLHTPAPRGAVPPR
jgi:hypothetical protein